MEFLSDQETDLPRRLSETSLDVKLFFAYGIVMVLLMLFGSTIPVEAQLTFTAMLAASLAVVSIVHRCASGWRWPGAGAQQVVAALKSAAMDGIFLFVAAIVIPPSNPAMLPWYLVGLGIGLFHILSDLRVVRPRKADFDADCRSASSPHAESAETSSAKTSPEARWQRWVRAAIESLFAFWWLSWMAFLYVRGTSERDGSTVQTATHSVRLFNAYITPAQAQLLDTLQTVMMVGVVFTVASAFALHYLFGVRLFRSE